MRGADAAYRGLARRLDFTLLACCGDEQMHTAILVLAVLLAVASLLPYLRKEAWWVRAFDFPRLQILALGLLAAILVITVSDVRSWQGAIAAIAVLITVLIQVISIFPYTPIAPKEVVTARDADSHATADASLSLLVANVLMSNRRADDLRKRILKYRPDVIVLAEPDAWWETQMRVLEGYGYRYSLKEPRDNKYGMLLYSRLPLFGAKIRHMIKRDVPSMRVRIRLRGGDEVNFYAVHPEPPAPTEATSSLPRDAELLLVGREVQDSGQSPTVVAGDLNDVAWSHTTRLFQKISGLLDPRRGRGMFNTFHARVPVLRWPLDHVFHSEHFLLAELRRLPAFGSDHFPVYARFVLKPGAARMQHAPRADEDDAAAAREKIAKAGNEKTE